MGDLVAFDSSFTCRRMSADEIKAFVFDESTNEADQELGLFLDFSRDELLEIMTEEEEIKGAPVYFCGIACKGDLMEFIFEYEW
ncbi:MAG: hypothetical protein [Circular genetic element sp.]|nr:MAG: hypothetical protein [Circular genetic element sp.]